MNNNLDETRIFSMISGKTQEESKKIIEENKEFAEKITDIVKYLGEISKSDADLMVRITTIISALLQPFPLEVRGLLLSQVASVSLSGKSDNMMETIRKCSLK